MRLPKPELDDLTFEELVDEARRLIPRYAPEWTDHNISDPGITLIDLFAWLTETSLYRLNLITNEHTKKYLQLLGIRPQPSQPAKVDLTFESKTKVTLKKNDIVSTEIEGKKIYFELTDEITVVPLNLKTIITDEVTGVFDRTSFNNEDDLFFAPFGENVRNNSALYLGFDKPADTLSLCFYLYEDDLIPPGSHGSESPHDFKNCEIRWEYVKALANEKDNDNDDNKTKNQKYEWQEITPSLDETASFKRSGRVLFKGINEWEAMQLPIYNSDTPLYWLRCVLVKSNFEYPPRIKRIRLNTITAIHGRTITDDTEERVSTGLPDQIFQLKHAPVLDGSLKLLVDGTEWQQKDDLYGSSAEDHHYILDRQEGRIIFGNGIMGRIPPEGAKITIESYRTGGGRDGNLRAGLTWVAEDYPELKITNYLSATGGKDEEPIEYARVRFLKDLQTPYRTVTSADFEYIAKNTPGLRVAAAKAIPEYHPDYKNDKEFQRDVVTVVVIPYTPIEHLEQPPEPSQGFLEAICRHLDRHRLLGTDIHVIPPLYIKVNVSLQIVPSSGFDETSLRTEILKTLNRYIHPVKGGEDGSGWPIGRNVYRSELYRLLEDIQGVDCITRLSISGDNGAKTDAEGNLILPSKISTVYSGNHSIGFLTTEGICRRKRR